MKVELITFNGIGHHRLFYVATDSPPNVNLVTATVYTALSGKKHVDFYHLEFEVYMLNFKFLNRGKYIFITFEDGSRKLISIVTID